MPNQRTNIMTTGHQATMMLSNRQSKIQPINSSSGSSKGSLLKKSKTWNKGNNERPNKQNDGSSKILYESPKQNRGGLGMRDSDLTQNQSVSTFGDSADSSPHKVKKVRETVAIIFDEDNSSKGEILTKTLSRSGCNVVVVLNKFNTQLVCSLLAYKRVSVSTADGLHDPSVVARLIDGSDRAVFVSSYFEKFANSNEEKRALLLIKACKVAGISNLTFSTLEDTEQLRRRGLRSQIQPEKDGSFHPTFYGMKAARRAARKANVQISYVITSYLNYESSNAFICFMSKGKDKPMTVRSYALEEPYAPKAKRIKVQSKKLSKKVARILRKKQNTMAEAKNDRILLTKFLNELLFCPVIKQTSFIKPFDETTTGENKSKKNSLTKSKYKAVGQEERDPNELLSNLLNELLFVNS